LILKAALEVFSERGYEGSTTKKIPDGSGVNQALIYQHFKNKEECILKMLIARLTKI
jgi:AcrR family transcriptional regulator